MTLTPAYGRDYKSKKEVLADFDKGKDFIIADIEHPYSGKPVDKKSLIVEGERQVMIRYRELTRVAVVKLEV
ncbi:MAG: hypothetical protein KAS32_30945 [Candidatus Peribacteraceae bacterium]|nr:hypothetical protein [Candidatus Peribacteraceae bacterium]